MPYLALLFFVVLVLSLLGGASYFLNQRINRNAIAAVASESPAAFTPFAALSDAYVPTRFVTPQPFRVQPSSSATLAWASPTNERAYALGLTGTFIAPTRQFQAGQTETLEAWRLLPTYTLTPTQIVVDASDYAWYADGWLAYWDGYQWVAYPTPGVFHDGSGFRVYPTQSP